MLRVSSYKHTLVKYPINNFCESKQTTAYNWKRLQFYKYIQLCLLCCVLCSFFSTYQDGHKSTNHSKLNDSTCADLMILINLGNYQEEIDPRTFHRLRWSSLWLCHKKLAADLEYSFTDFAGLLDLPLYKWKTKEVLKVKYLDVYRTGSHS